jgi:hypothetical protein
MQPKTPIVTKTTKKLILFIFLSREKGTRYCAAIFLPRTFGFVFDLTILLLPFSMNESYQTNAFIHLRETGALNSLLLRAKFHSQKKMGVEHLWCSDAQGTLGGLEQNKISG